MEGERSEESERIKNAGMDVKYIMAVFWWFSCCQTIPTWKHRHNLFDIHECIFPGGSMVRARANRPRIAMGVKD